MPPPADRILVIGCPGAGKTTFADRLAASSGLPLTNLDREFWQPGWVMPPSDSWRERVRQLAAPARWIIEGNYGSTLDLRLPRADLVVWFDYPRTVCLRRAVWRSVRGYGRVRPDMAPSCPERIDFGFYRYVWTFNDIHRPIIVEALARHCSHLQPVIFQRDSEARRFLDARPPPVPEGSRSAPMRTSADGSKAILPHSLAGDD